MLFRNKTKAREYDREIQKSHTADQPMAPWGKATEQKQSQGTRQTNKVKQPALSSSPSWLIN